MHLLLNYLYSNKLNKALSLRLTSSLTSLSLLFIAFLLASSGFAVAQSNKSDVSRIFEAPDTGNATMKGQSSPAGTNAPYIELHPQAMQQYLVVRGDTVLSVASKFLKTPQQWSEIWQDSKNKNSNKLYPGDIVRLLANSGIYKLEVTHAGKKRTSNPLIAFSAPGLRHAASTEVYTYERPVKLYPSAIEIKEDINKAFSIPAQDIEPFLHQSVIEEPWQHNRTPRLLESESGRTTLGVGDVVFAEGIDPNGAMQWEIYHPGRQITDPNNGRYLGRENIHVGRVVFTKVDHRVATGKIIASNSEIAPGDLLFPMQPRQEKSYIPVSPDLGIVGNVVAVSNGGGYTVTGQSYVIIINRGAEDGLVEGNVLALYRPRGKVASYDNGRKIQLPDARYGLIYVFRTFERVSYALVTESTEQISIGDIVATP